VQLQVRHVSIIKICNGRSPEKRQRTFGGVRAEEHERLSRLDVQVGEVRLILAYNQNYRKKLYYEHIFEEMSILGQVKSRSKAPERGG
jgi:hypothetical protein